MRTSPHPARTRLSRVAAGVLALGCALAGTALSATSASAAVIGPVVVDPTSGDEFGQFGGTVTGNCPADTEDAIFLMEGPGIEPRTSLLGDPAETTTGPYSFSGASIANIKSTTGGFTASGAYSIQLFCQDPTGVDGDIFEAIMDFTVGTGGNPGTYTIRGGAAADIATTTTLTTSATGTVQPGESVTLTADVNPATPPDAPVGTVEFLNNGTPLGAGSALSADGVSTLATTALPSGANSITAVYTPTAGSGFASSTSAASVVTVAAGPTTPPPTTPPPTTPPPTTPPPTTPPPTSSSSSSSTSAGGAVSGAGASRSSTAAAGSGSGSGSGGSGSGSLARTGIEAAGILGLGGALVTGGVLLVRLSRARGWLPTGSHQD